MYVGVKHTPCKMEYHIQDSLSTSVLSGSCIDYLATGNHRKTTCTYTLQTYIHYGHFLKVAGMNSLEMSILRLHIAATGKTTYNSMCNSIYIAIIMVAHTTL